MNIISPVTAISSPLWLGLTCSPGARGEGCTPSIRKLLKIKEEGLGGSEVELQQDKYLEGSNP